MERATARQLLEHPWILAYKDRDEDLRSWVQKANAAKEELIREQKKKRASMDWSEVGLAQFEGIV